MKIFSYEVRFDEVQYLEALKSDKLTIEYTDQILTIDNVELCRGYDAVNFLALSFINKDILNKLHEFGIKYIATRSVGYNHIDMDHARKLGIKVCNASYPPTSVAEYTVMLILMVLRNYKQSLYRGNINDYSLIGLGGRTLKSLTIGVVGTGKIGATVANLLKGFGCKIFAYDPYENKALNDVVTYTTLEEIYEKSDIITLHVPYFKENYHMISDNEISKMKKGVIIINAARGELISNKALINGIESGHIGGLGLDAVDGEYGLIHIDHKLDILKNQEIAYLKQFPNVTITPHIAFYTDDATKNMVEIATRGLIAFLETGHCDYEIK